MEDDPAQPELLTLPPAMPPAPEGFRFTGDGGEYFRIWIVNLLLTVLTLGIYSAWAKVRRLQYFYQHTELAGSRFDYHGKPIAILKGRLIALLMLIAYHFSFDISIGVGIVTLIMLAAVFPWLLRSSFRFRAYYSSYRGLHFWFRGSLGQSYRIFLGYGALSLLTLYLAVPLFHQRLKLYQHGNAGFGTLPSSFQARVGSFYRVYAITGLVSLATAAALMFLFSIGSGFVGGLFGDMDDATRPVMLGGTAVVGLLLLRQFVGPLFAALIGNLVWNNTRLGEHRLESRLEPATLMWIGIGNAVLVILTLGLFMPWAAVRVARYRAACLTLIPAAGFDTVFADPERSVGAAGEESAEMFGFDIGL